MSKLNEAVIPVLLILLSLNIYSEPTGQSSLYTLEETTGEDVSTYNLNIKFENDHYYIQTEFSLFVYTKDFECHLWKYKNEEDNSSFTAELKNGYIQVRGIYYGERVSKKFRVKKNFWHQAYFLIGPEPNLKQNRKEIVFNVIDMDEMKMREMLGRREKRETLTLAGRSVAGEHYVITLPGFMGMFWDSDFWYNPENGRFLLSKVPRGPNAPVTTTEDITKL